MRYFIAAIGYLIIGLLVLVSQFLLTTFINTCKFIHFMIDSLEVEWLNFVLPEPDEDEEED